jgi:hypothetical protein
LSIRQHPADQDISPTYCARDDIYPSQRPNGVTFSDHNIQGQLIDLLALGNTQHPGTFDPNFTGLEELTATSSSNCLQQNPMAIAMGPGAQYSMGVNSIADVCQMQTVNPMDAYDTSFIDSMDLASIINMDATNNAEWVDGMTRANDITNVINAGQNQIDVSLGHSVTIIIWFRVSFLLFSRHFSVHPSSNSLAQNLFDFMLTSLHFRILCCPGRRLLCLGLV